MAKVLSVSHTYPIDSESEITPFVHQISREASKNGHEVHVLVPENEDLKPEEFEEITIHGFKYDSNGSIEYHSVPNDCENISPLEATKFVYHGFRAARRLDKEHRFDLLHTHWAVPSGAIGFMMKKFSKIPFILHTHGRDVYNEPEAGYDILSDWRARTVIKRVLRSADCVVANSKETRSRACKLGASFENSSVIPFGVNLDMFSPENSDLDLRPDYDTMIVFVGRLVERKGVQHLIKAVQRCEEDVHLSVIGGGSYRQRLEDMAEDSNRIDFLGVLDHSSLAEYMATADIVAVPSLVEPFGIVNIEALASATPVIAAKTGGITDIIDENVGALFPPGDVEELKEAIDELAGNDDLLERLSLKARERAVQKYSWDNFGNRLEEVYESIYDPRKDPSP